MAHLYINSMNKGKAEKTLLTNDKIFIEQALLQSLAEKVFECTSLALSVSEDIGGDIVDMRASIKVGEVIGEGVDACRGVKCLGNPSGNVSEDSFKKYLEQVV